MMEQETREKYRVRDKKKGVRQGEPLGGLCTWGPKEIQLYKYYLFLKDDEFTSCFISEFSRFDVKSEQKEKMFLAATATAQLTRPNFFHSWKRPI